MSHVSIRAPAWGATSTPFRHLTDPAFQFALPRGERQGAGRPQQQRQSFNSRSRVGSDLRRVRNLRCGKVSIRAPAWGATRQRRYPSGSARFQFALPRGERLNRFLRRDILRSFNSRSRVGSDLTSIYLGTWATVSIRAPAWGATIRVFEGLKNVAVSIRAPAWGATLQALIDVAKYAVSIRAPAWGATNKDDTPKPAFAFQFALPRGERLKKLAKEAYIYVSIRAPAWGATHLMTRTSARTQFQFALPRGERRCYPKARRCTASFQFALPRGERRV